MHKCTRCDRYFKYESDYLNHFKVNPSCNERIPLGDIGRNAFREQEEKDNINPDHYKSGGIETIEYMQAKLTKEEFKGYLKGNILKYTSRAELKGGIEDYKKAKWYANRLVSFLESQEKK